MSSSWTGHHQPSPEQVLALAPPRPKPPTPPCSPRRRQRYGPSPWQQVGHPAGVQGIVQPGQQRLPHRDVPWHHHVGQELLLNGGDPQRRGGTYFWCRPSVFRTYAILSVLEKIAKLTVVTHFSFRFSACEE